MKHWTELLLHPSEEPDKAPRANTPATPPVERSEAEYARRSARPGELFGRQQAPSKQQPSRAARPLSTPPDAHRFGWQVLSQLARACERSAQHDDHQPFTQALRQVLRRETDQGNVLAEWALSDAAAVFRDAMVRAVSREAAGLLAQLIQFIESQGEPDKPTAEVRALLCAAALSPSGPLLWADAVAAGHLEALNDTELGQSIRRRGEQLWSLHGGIQPSVKLWSQWVPDMDGATRILRLIALTLWEQKWETQARHQRRPAVLVQAIATPLAEVMDRAFLDRSTGQIVSANDGHQLPLIPTETAGRVSGVDALGTLSARRLIGALPRLCAAAHVSPGSQIPLIDHPGSWVQEVNGAGVLLHVEGGWETLALMVGVPVMSRGAHKGRPSHKLRKQVEDTVMALCIPMRWTGPRGHVCIDALVGLRDLSPHAPGQRSSLTLRISEPFMPQYYAQFPKGQRALVPILDVPPLAMVHSRVQPKVARLEWLAVIELRNQAREVAQHGGAVIAWDQLASRVQLSSKHLQTVLQCWTQKDGAYSRWEFVGKHRYHLADIDYLRPARDHILEAGQQSLTGKSRGQASTAKRAK